MIEGIVNVDFEAMISLSICDSDGMVYTQDAIVTSSWNVIDGKLSTHGSSL
jgi:hypothetical protein